MVTAEGDLAPGLLAGRFGDAAGRSRVPCPGLRRVVHRGRRAAPSTPRCSSWSTPTPGPAVVDVDRLRPPRAGRRARAARGARCPAGPSYSIDLAQRVPRRDDLALHVTTTRGRVSASVVDTYDELGSGGSATDYLPSQPAPATSNLLLGLPEGTGRRTLLLANPAETETRAEHQGRDRGRGVRRRGHRRRRGAAAERRPSLGLLVAAGKNAADAMGLLVESSDPVTASARFYVDGDLTPRRPARTGRGDLGGRPDGRQAAAARRRRRAGAVAVVSRDADGEVVAEDRLEVDGRPRRRARPAGRGGPGRGSPPTAPPSTGRCWPPATARLSSGCGPCSAAG